MDEARRVLLRLAGKGAVFLAFLVQIAAAARAFVPNVLYEPSRRFKTRKPDRYPQGVTFNPERRLFVFREENDFHAISAVCTHLGCTVQWKGEKGEFACPCHGSWFRRDGSVIKGPAPRPLPSYALSFSPDGYLQIDTAEEVASDFRLLLPKQAT
jgi:cytochrome b6-f complex iron-sulfur subunit